jgi:hypothetical protein
VGFILVITYIPPLALIYMIPYIYAALILHAASLGLGIAGQATASAATGVASVALIGVVLTRTHRELEDLKNAYWDRLAGVWLGAEYTAAIWLFVLSGIGSQLLSAFLWLQLASLFPAVVSGGMEMEITGPEEVGRFLGIAALALGVLALTLVWFVAWAYLIEVFTRDLYLIRVVSGVDGFRPFSATFYIIISLITVWFLYFYWLYSVWRWITQLKTSTRLPHSSQGPVAQ